ncbi:hypothetical protein [Leptospira borgpetersenii]|uniref:hypothetical protein n=1 Tax=Leptospira borgpetersenii TaxID=174 RepID=UPI0009B5F39E|nr:hypothetical protein [Leptospira borgpetersenii]AXX17092.1 hypothetical protein C4Q31_01780 [Leptospira borgpetersenii serovar Ceylonica]MDQ7243587.1 hypothetical protein [Leptospira borgpetersenii]QVK49365.1 hypothetical protein FH601_12605 [Leptospira borgpetersenii]QVK52409.1 hypothetical protein FH600_01650 [Leptospira borgpetersenii]QVK55594.1 hypothetical protein FH599_01650 [Leptospira borgpetersenii]
MSFSKHRGNPCVSSKNPSQNLKKNIFQRSGKFLKNVGVPTETVALRRRNHFLKERSSIL